jgi:hypothetical protein
MPASEITSWASLGWGESTWPWGGVPRVVGARGNAVDSRTGRVYAGTASGVRVYRRGDEDAEAGVGAHTARRGWPGLGR